MRPDIVAAMRPLYAFILLAAVLARSSMAQEPSASANKTAGDVSDGGHNVLAGQGHVRLPGLVPLPG